MVTSLRRLQSRRSAACDWAKPVLLAVSRAVSAGSDRALGRRRSCGFTVGLRRAVTAAPVVSHNVAMGKHSGGRVDGPPSRSLALLSGGAVLTVTAWVVLVTYAIKLGSLARSGEPAAWALLAVATLGAICCLFLGLVLGGRLLGLVRTEPRTATARVPGGRRARR